MTALLKRILAAIKPKGTSLRDRGYPTLEELAALGYTGEQFYRDVMRRMLNENQRRRRY